MEVGITAAVQAPPAMLRKVRRLQSLFCKVMIDWRSILRDRRDWAA
jgi:hypothetical protein